MNAISVLLFFKLRNNFSHLISGSILLHFNQLTNLLSESSSCQKSRSRIAFLTATTLCALETHCVSRTALRSLLSAAGKCVRELSGRGQLAPQLLACLGVLSRLRSLLLSSLEKPLSATYRLALRALVRRLANAPRKAIRLASKSDSPTQPALFVRRVGRRVAIFLRFQLPTGRPLSIRLPLPARLAPLEPSDTVRGTDTAELQPPSLPAARAEGPADELDVTRERLRAADSANPLPAAAAQLRRVQQQQLSLLPLRALSKRSGNMRHSRTQRAASSIEEPSGGSAPTEAPATFAPDELEIALRAESSGLSRAQRKRMRTQLVAALSKTRRN